MNTLECPNPRCRLAAGTHQFPTHACRPKAGVQAYRRSRECPGCGERFFTLELTEAQHSDLIRGAELREELLKELRHGTV